MRETKGDHATMAIIISMPCFLWGLVIWMGFTNQNIDLTYLNTFRGEVIDRGTTIRKAKRIRDPDASVFFVNVRGLNQTLGIYRMSGNYSDLVNKIIPGDSITVYYKFQEKTDINIDLIQVEKDGRVLIDATEYEKKESSLIYIGFVALLLNIGYSIYYYHDKTKKKSVD